MEIHDDSNYEGRSLGRCLPYNGGQGFANWFIQVTGRANHQDFADYMEQIGQPDPGIMAIGEHGQLSVTPGALAAAGGATAT